jgi:hypothetical protein
MSTKTRFQTDVTARRAAIVAGIASAFVLAACSDSMGIGARNSSQLSFTTGAGASANAAPAALAPIANGSDTLNLTQITVTISRAELERADNDVCAGDNDDDHGDDNGGQGGNSGNCAEVKVGAASFDLPVDGSLVTLQANAIPAGMFRKFELRVASVRLKGTFDSKPFDVTIPVNTKAEVEFATPLVVTAGAPTTITVNVSAGTWLTNTNGTLIDPNKIATSPSLLATIKARIAASLNAFEDEDHDGRDDHGKEGDGHGRDG